MADLGAVGASFNPLQSMTVDTLAVDTVVASRGGYWIAMILPGMDVGIKGGNYRVYGQTKEGTTAVSRRVDLYREGDMTVRIASMQSDASGNYEFTDLPNFVYVVVSYDPSNTYNAVIRDSVVPELTIKGTTTKTLAAATLSAAGELTA